MPLEDDARAILRLALRHEQSLAASLDPAFAQKNWGFLAQQCLENLLKGLIVLTGEQPPLSRDLERLQLLAGVVLPQELLALQEFAVKALLTGGDTAFRLPRGTAGPWGSWGSGGHRRPAAARGRGWPGTARPMGLG